jgi:hypothetical protein
LPIRLGFGLLPLKAQQQRTSQPVATADPYANNPAAGTMKFPLAAPVGKDLGAITKVPPGAVNQGIIDEKTWKYGHAYDAPHSGKIWNPVKFKMMRGEKITAGTVFVSSDPSTHCAMANAGRREEALPPPPPAQS